MPVWASGLSSESPLAGTIQGREAFNQAMRHCRISVEWIFDDVVESFKSMDFKNNLKIGLSSVRKMYIVI